MTTNNNNHGSVLITGASSGIGRELALEFGACAETLVVVARRLDRLEKLRAELLSHHPGLKVIALAADLSDERDVERLLGQVSEQAGPVDVLVNNAGLGDSVLFDRSDWTRTRQLLRTNVFAMAQLASALVPGMVKRGRGGVLNIGSGAHRDAKRGGLRGKQAFRSRVQRSATGRSCGYRYNGDTSLPGSGGQRIRPSVWVRGRHGRRTPAILSNQRRAVCTRSASRIRARRRRGFPRPGLSLFDEGAPAVAVVVATQAGGQRGGSAPCWTVR
jgi:hypothetical protein